MISYRHRKNHAGYGYRQHDGDDKNVMECLARQDTANTATYERLNVITAAIAPSAANDTDPETARRQLFQTDYPTIQGTDHAKNKKIAVLQSTMHDITSRIYKVTSLAPEIQHVLSPPL